MDRRSLFLSLPLAAALPAWGRQTQMDAWSQWKSRYLTTDGRVMDDVNGGISHSEGQAYGLLLAQAFGDRAAFEQIETWTRTELAVRPDDLLAWKWFDGTVVDQRNATDGDLLRAWALLRADRDSGWSAYRDSVASLCRAVVEHCLAPDPRASDEVLLKPASDATATGTSVILNPSYYMIRALIEVGTATGEVALLRAAAHGERLLADPRAMKDWVEVTVDGLAAAPDLSANFGWDALRLPLYLYWSGRADHPVLSRASARFATATLPGHVATVTDPSGQMLSQSDASGFRAVADLASGQGPLAPRIGEGYYTDTLALLAQVAWREGR